MAISVDAREKEHQLILVLVMLKGCLGIGNLRNGRGDGGSKGGELRWYLRRPRSFIRWIGVLVRRRRVRPRRHE